MLFKIVVMTAVATCIDDSVNHTGRVRPNSPCEVSFITELNKSYMSMPSMHDSEKLRKRRFDVEELGQIVERAINEKKSYEKIDKLLRLECMIERHISRLIKSPSRGKFEEKRRLVLLSDYLKRITHYFDTKIEETDVYFGGFKRVNTISDEESFRSITDLMFDD